MIRATEAYAVGPENPFALSGPVVDPVYTANMGYYPAPYIVVSYI